MLVNVSFNALLPAHNSGQLEIRQDSGCWGLSSTRVPDRGPLEGRGLGREPPTFPGTPVRTQQPSQGKDLGVLFPGREVAPKSRQHRASFPNSLPTKPPPRLPGQQVKMTEAGAHTKGPPSTRKQHLEQEETPADTRHSLPVAFQGERRVSSLTQVATFSIVKLRMGATGVQWVGPESAKRHPKCQHGPSCTAMSWSHLETSSERPASLPETQSLSP